MCSRPSPTTASALRASRPSRRSAEPSRGHLRVSDRDREHAAETLREHAAAGRITLNELSDRLEAALTASTQAELDKQFADLPPATPSKDNRQVPVKRAGMPIHATAYICVSLAMIAIWAATSRGYFWPAWPIMGWGIGVISHLSGCGFALRRLERDDPTSEQAFPSPSGSEACR